jgi:hypothetical protein
MKEPPVEQNGLDWTPPFYSQEAGVLRNEKPDRRSRPREDKCSYIAQNTQTIGDSVNPGKYLVGYCAGGGQPNNYFVDASIQTINMGANTLVRI